MPINTGSSPSRGPSPSSRTTETLAGWGGQAVVLPYLDGHSTTALVERSRT